MRIDDLSALPEWAQKQVMEKLGGLGKNSDKKPHPSRPSAVPPSPEGKAGEEFSRNKSYGVASGCAEIQMREEFGRKTNKYGNQRAEIAGIKFDSKKEARRFLELSAMERDGEISELKLQQDFHLTESYTKTDGERVRGIVYRADFCYRDSNGKTVVEDVKSTATRTRTYLLKKKLMREKFGIEISEV